LRCEKACFTAQSGVFYGLKRPLSQEKAAYLSFSAHRLSAHIRDIPHNVLCHICLRLHTFPGAFRALLLFIFKFRRIQRLRKSSMKEKLFKSRQLVKKGQFFFNTEASESAEKIY